MTDAHPNSGSNPDPDTDWNALPEAEFRAHLRHFIDGNCPQHLRYVRRRLPPADTLPWYHALAAAGLIAPGWPRIHGGMALSPGRHLVFIEEMDAAGTPWLHDSGVRNLGLAIIAHGTDAQKQRYLPAIHAGDQIWCQGYSEPGAGSDLASLRCAGEIDGDRLTINGQKIWTTSGQHANHMFMLLRTERGTTAHRGITFALVDMATPGITVRPIYNLNDEADFCEVFFDDVTISTDCILGQPHDGWNVARSVLGFERIWAGSPRRARHALGELEAIVAQSGLSGDAVWQDRLVQAEFDTLDAQDLYRTFAELITSDGQVGTEVSALKIFSTETFQRISEWTLEAAGAEGALATNLDSDARSAQPLYTFFESRAPTIFSGTNEIHRNILARRALGLGREDKA